MDLRSLYQKHFVDLYREGFVDDQFTELQKLQDENNPEFLKEVITIYFEDCEKIIGNMARALEPQIVDFKLVDSHVHQLKGSSSSVGAVKIKNACITFRAFCEAQNREGCLRCLQLVNHEYTQLKNKYETISGLAKQIVDAGLPVPVMQ